MKNFEHFSVNWVKGMNINASHFIDTENFFLERLAKITYYLLPISKYNQ